MGTSGGQEQVKKFIDYLHETMLAVFCDSRASVNRIC
jgi:1,4-alpha-glucan branching enzyme